VLTFGGYLNLSILLYRFHFLYYIWLIYAVLFNFAWWSVQEFDAVSLQENFPTDLLVPSYYLKIYVSGII
jgi:hypothetical protein